MFRAEFKNEKKSIMPAWHRSGKDNTSGVNLHAIVMDTNGSREYRTNPRERYKVYPHFYGQNGNGGAVHRKALEAGQEEAPPSLFLAFFSPTAHFPVPSRQSASQAAYAMPTSLLATILQTPGGYMWHISPFTEPRRCVSWRCQGDFVKHDARIFAVASVAE